MSLVKICVLLTLVAIVSARLSYYYAPQGLNYHPPYDKYTGAYDLNGTTAAGTCVNNFNCPAGQVRSPNPNFVPTIANGCAYPAWVQDQTILGTYTGCCQRYSACLQTCNINKAFCDGQFYGCAYQSCDPQRQLRPGDRLYCRALSSCYASYLTRPASCNQFNDYQNAACVCVNQGTFASQSNIPVGKRQVDASSTSTTSESTSNVPSVTSSTIPSASPSTVSSATTTTTASLSPSIISATPTPVFSSAAANSNDLYANRFGNYFVRPIPRWELFQNRCPPNFENYVAVFTDQEQDDIGYYGRAQGSAGSISSWLKF